MNFSQEFDCGNTSGCQSTFFATSKDLRTWERVPDQLPGVNDSNVFKYGKGYSKGGRWDCITTVPKPGEPNRFYGFWTASPNVSGDVGAGVGETTDGSGYHWRSLPPIIDELPSGEVGSVIAANGTYFMLFGGGHLYTSRHPISGYTKAKSNHDFLVDGDGAAFARLWSVGDGLLLVTHQWVTDYKHPADAGKVWLAPIKQAVLGSDGVLRAHYWPANEALKGDVIVLHPAALGPPWPPANPQVGVDKPATVVQMLSPSLELGIGVVAETTVDCSHATAAMAGFAVANASGFGTAFVWNCANQTFNAGPIGGSSGGTTFEVDRVWDRATHFGLNATVHLRLLLRRPALTGTRFALLVEWYGNDVLAHPYTTWVHPTNTSLFLGTVVVNSTSFALLGSVSAWRMTLPFQ